MDTKSKKLCKLKNLLIILIVVLPSIILTSLYPLMEHAMLEKEKQWREEWEKQKEEYENELADREKNNGSQEQETKYLLQEFFINYAIETSYYQYAILKQQATGEESYFNVLDEYGWINDYYRFINKTPYYVKYTFINSDGEEEVITMSDPKSYSSPEYMEEIFLNRDGEELPEEDKDIEGYLGYLYLNYDSYGKLVDIRLNINNSIRYEADVYERAKASIDQYKNNAVNYSPEREQEEISYEKALTIEPKNFQAVYLIYSTNGYFMISDWNSYGDMYGDPFESIPDYPPSMIYFSTGAYFVVAIMVLFVMVAAILLPFLKKLETGYEKIFSLPAEITACIAVVTGVMVLMMCFVMSYTTVAYITDFIETQGMDVEILGYRFSPVQCYNILLVVNFVGWTLTFILEYICVAHIRQFFRSPRYYIKHRFLIVIIIRKVNKKLKEIINSVFHMEIEEVLHSGIIRIVIINGFIISGICCFWFVGIPLAIIYSFILYFLMKKYGCKLQKQYNEILDATRQMAEGRINVTWNEEKGIFSTLGKELEAVKEGLAKAVEEKAKSQNMKSELITNVSHDLKTPLTSIITYVNLLKQEGITEEERKSYIETLDLKSQRMKALIEDLFEVSKANTGNVQMNIMDVDIIQLMKEVRVELSDEIEKSKLDFRFNLPDKKIYLKLDGLRTYRIFENLLNNAIKYSMPATRVYVEIVDSDMEVMIIFKNISDRELNVEPDYLTERFVRGDSARNSEGSGLGLAIAKSFTRLQDGKFDISIDGDLFKVCIRFYK